MNTKMQNQCNKDIMYLRALVKNIPPEAFKKLLKTAGIGE